jgi:uncharacterized protein YqeY
MPDPIKERVDADLKDAMRAKEKLRVETLRGVLSAISYRRIDAGRDLSEEEVTEVVAKLVKQRGDSIAEFTKAGRQDLVDKESAERSILLAYLPPQMPEDEVAAIVREALASLAPTSRNQAGAMRLLVPKLKGKADGNLIRVLVERELAAEG